MSYTKIIEKRLRLLDFNEETFVSLKKIQAILEPSIEHILDRFYVQIERDPELMALFPNERIIAQARKGQKEHWIDILFSGDIGKAHFDNAEMIGQTHERIGLSLSQYLGGYSIMMNQFLRVISDHYHDDNIGMTKKIHALNKAVFMDIDSVIDSYLEAKDRAIQKVLIQTEQFSAGLKELNSSLEIQATSHQKYISALWNKGESLNQRTLELEKKIAGTKKHKPNGADDSNQQLIALLHESAALLKANRENHTEMAKAKLQASELADQINRLNPRHDSLKDYHRCHFTIAGKKPLLQRVKSFLSSH